MLNVSNRHPPVYTQHRCVAMRTFRTTACVLIYVQIDFSVTSGHAAFL